MAIVADELEVASAAVEVVAAAVKNDIAVVGDILSQAGTYDGTLISKEGNTEKVGVAAAAAVAAVATTSGDTDPEAGGVGKDVDVVVASGGVINVAAGTAVSDECTAVDVAVDADVADGADSIPTSPDGSRVPFGDGVGDGDVSTVVKLGGLPDVVTPPPDASAVESGNTASAILDAAPALSRTPSAWAPGLAPSSNTAPRVGAVTNGNSKDGGESDNVTGTSAGVRSC